MTPEEFYDFVTSCEEVTISQGEVQFTGYNGNPGDYHVERGYWLIPFTLVIQMIKDHIDEWNECESDEDKMNWIKETGSDIFEFGGGVSDIHDYDTLSYNIDSLGYVNTESVDNFDGFTDFYYIEDYPYDSGSYSGVYDIFGDEFVEFNHDPDSSPGPGPEYSGLVVNNYLLKKVKESVS